MVADTVTVHNFDSRTATMGLGLIVLSAARMVEAGKPLEDILAALRQIIAGTNIYFLLDSLDNLHKGGRIGKASHLFGSLLNIKPVLNLSDGVISAYETVSYTHLQSSILQQPLPLLLTAQYSAVIMPDKLSINICQLRLCIVQIYLPNIAPFPGSTAQFLRLQHHLLMKIAERPAIAIIELPLKGHQQADRLFALSLLCQTFPQQSAGITFFAGSRRCVHALSLIHI